MVDFGQLGVDAATAAGVAAARPVSVVVQVRRVRVVGHGLLWPVVVVVHHPVVVVVPHGTAASVVTKNFTVGRNLCGKKIT